VQDAPITIGRYELRERIKTTAGVATFTGVDTADGAPVIVKVVGAADVSTAELLRLEHEAAVLSALSSDEFRPLLASGQDGERFYLVQPRHEGVSLQQRLLEGPLGLPAALQMAADVLDRLRMAHEQGILHRDIKPENIVVGDDGHAELIDFGFARSSQLHESLQEEAVGTIRYVSPEAAGLIHREADQRSDLYSFGIVLYESLAGRAPFTAETGGEVLRQHLNTRPPHLRSLGVAVPAAVDGLVQRLLAKEPEERYQSAAATLADVREIAEQLAAGLAEPTVIPGLHDRRHSLTEPSFIGRHDELSLFASLLDLTRQGGGGLVLLEAESGGGKSRLLDEVALQAARRSFLVLRGQGVDQAAQRPFQVLDGVARGVVALGTDSATVRHLRAELGARTQAAVAALPGLKEPLQPDDDVDLGPEAFGEARSVDALASLLDALGGRSQPAVVILDDCQWADGLTAALLERWQSRIASGRPAHVLVIAAFRSEEVSSTHPLRAISPLHHLALPPFTESDVRTLCTSMAGQLPEDALAALVTLAEGSPFMASALLRGMVESGLLRGAREGWEIEETELADVQTSRRAALHLARRFDVLSPAALTLLRTGAILGKEFDLTLALELAQLDQTDATEALHEARQRRILWVDEADNRCAFAHDKLRETLLDRFDDSERRDLHERAAELLERRSPDQSFELAYHFDAAGDPDRALPHALRAADLARERHALEAAIGHYRIAERAALHADAATQARIAEGLGDVLTLAGAYDEAAVALQRALDLSPDLTDQAVIEGKLGNVAFKRGDQTTARHYLEGGLRHLGRWVPRNPIARFAATLFEVFVQTLHTLLPRLFVNRRSPDGAERELLALRMYSRLAYVYWFSAGSVACAWAHIRNMNLAERYPPTLELAQAYSEHAPVMTMVPWFSRGMAYVRRSYEIRRELGDVWGQGQSLNFTGVTTYTNSQYRECIEQCREAVRLLERTGDRWEQNTALWQMALSHYRLGELATTAEIAEELYSSATALGDQSAAGIVLSSWARATMGRVPAAYVATELARDNDDAHTATEVHVAEGVRLLYQGDLDTALELFEQAHKIMRKAGLRQEFVAPVPAWLATVHRMRAEEAVDAGRRQRRKLARRAARAARAADRLARFYRNNRPHSLRERGLTEELLGNHRRADRLLERSRSLAERQGAAFEAAQTRAAQTRLAVAHGRPGAGERLAHAEADLERFLAFAMGDSQDLASVDARRTLSVADRFESMLQVARNIGAATSDHEIFDAVRTAALLLLRGERCHVVQLRGPKETALETLSGEHVTEVSRSLLSEAIEQRSPVVASRRAGLSDSIVLSEYRSALCAPILHNDQVAACFYLSHRRVDGLFGDLEIQLAEFIATLAGAALEQVAGSEARFRSLVQHSSDVITVIDREGTITYMSDSIERLFGYTASELVGTNLRALLDADNAANLRDYLKPGGWPLDESALVAAQVRHKDGSWRDIEATVTSLFDDSRVQGVVLNTREVTERLALQAELRERAWHDALTGLANRALFSERVEHALELRARDARPLAVAFLDLDAFKATNDTLGHHGGDLLLQGVASRLRDCVRPGDTLARFGGDEFALLLEDASASAAASVANRILAALDRPFELLGREVYARASIGLAVAHPSDTAETLLSAADTAMYVAKARGSSRYELFEAHMRSAARERATLRGDLEGALDRDELVVHYQPVVAIGDGSVVGVEALTRWRHPTRGLLGPDAFIELAEESGLIVRLGRWVLRAACEQAAQWRRQLGRPLVVAVNVSARQFQGAGLVEDVARVLSDTGLDPSSLVLEITESATVPDAEHMIERLDELKALGVGLAIDDFGTGYSSLSYLRRFPVDQLKIDRAFVSGICTSVEDRSIVAAVVDLAHALGLLVVAEGVETVDQLEQLSQLGCDLAQGYNWLRPTDSQNLRGWLQPVLEEMTTDALGGVRVLVADDRASVRATLRIALEIEGGFEVVGEADDAPRTVELAAELQPDVVLLDVDMPGTSGLAVIPELRNVAPAASIVLLTALDTATVLASGGQAADVVLDKTRDLQTIVGHLATLAS
jgi:two-component system sensor kinase